MLGRLSIKFRQGGGGGGGWVNRQPTSTLSERLGSLHYRSPREVRECKEAGESGSVG